MKIYVVRKSIFSDGASYPMRAFYNVEDAKKYSVECQQSVDITDVSFDIDEIEIELR